MKLLFLSLLVLFFSDVSFAKNPPVYCVKKMTEEDKIRVCDAYLFGSMHLGFSDATTTQLVAIARKSSHVYFESLVPIQGTPPFRMNEFTQPADNFRNYVYRHARENYLPVDSKSLYALLTLKKGAVIDFNIMYRRLSSAMANWCGYTYVYGTEMAIFISLIGYPVLLNLVEPNTKVSNSLNDMNANFYSYDAIASLTPESSDKQIEEALCPPVRAVEKIWINQKECLDKPSFCRIAVSREDGDEEHKRNNVMFENAMKATLRGEAPLIIIGLKHLYGEQGLLSKFKKIGYSVSVAP